MLKLIIEDDEGRRTVVPFVRDEITIGRQEGNTIRLTERNVSRRHARLLRQNGTVVVEDLGSYNGIRVNGERVSGRASVADGDLIQIGDYDLAIQHEDSDQPVNAPTPPPDAARPSTGVRTHLEEVETDAASPAYEEAEPLGEVAGEDDAAPAPKRGDPETIRRQSTSIIRVDQVQATRTREVLELDPEEAPRLVVLNTEFAGREFACIRTELRIGRADDNDISLDHRSLSRTHAKLVREENGEWRIIDLQSANGLMVNGEPYAEATVDHLDTIELGHVKLKFVGAGESYTFVPGAEDRFGPSRKGEKSKVPLIIGGAAIVALIAAAGVFVAMGRGKNASAPPQPEQLAQQPRPPGPAKQPEQAAVPTKPNTSPEPAPTREDPAVAATAEANQKLNLARAAISENDFERAVPLLEAVKAIPNVTRTSMAEAEDLLDKARAERMMKERLDQAEKAIATGKYEQAKKLLDESAATEAFADRHQLLGNQLAAKLSAEAQNKGAAASKREEKAAAPAKDQVEPVNDTGDEALRLFDDGRKLLEKRQTREARATLLKCVEVNPRYAPCHLLLGAAHAKLGEVDQGAKHYDLFLKLAPDAPEAPKVRLMLQQYRDSKKQ